MQQALLMNLTDPNEQIIFYCLDTFKARTLNIIEQDIYVFAKANRGNLTFETIDCLLNLQINKILTELGLPFLKPLKSLKTEDEYNGKRISD